MDWTATILAAAGTAPDSAYPLDGENLLPVCAGTRPAYDRTFCWRTTTESAARMGRSKCLRESSGEQLFDLSSDPRGEGQSAKQSGRGVREDKEPIRGVEHSNAATALVISFALRKRNQLGACTDREPSSWLRSVTRGSSGCFPDQGRIVQRR